MIGPGSSQLPGPTADYQASAPGAGLWSGIRLLLQRSKLDFVGRSWARKPS